MAVYPCIVMEATDRPTRAVQLGSRVWCICTLQDLVLQFSLFPTSVAYTGVSETYSTVEFGWIIKTLNHGKEKILAWFAVG